MTHCSRKSAILMAAVSLMLAGCASHDKHGDGATRQLIFSPNGEVLNGGPLGRPTCQVAMTGWFNARADASGKIGHDAFLADARAAFKRMDIDHNGYLTAEELDRYRAPYRQISSMARDESADAAADMPGASSGSGGGRHHHGDKGGGGGDGGSDSSGVAQIDPVMSADQTLNGIVTMAEFMAQAERVFTSLDSGKASALALDNVLTLCPTKD